MSVPGWGGQRGRAVAAGGRGACHGGSGAGRPAADATLANPDRALLERVWRGKAEGAWVLHQATLDAELDFFAVYSSLASLVGSPGQAAYAAANAYPDALVTRRPAEGLPATGIHWGAWSQIGRGQHLAERGFVMISPDEGMEAFEQILAEGHHQIACSPIGLGLWTTPYPALKYSTLLSALRTSTSTHAGSPVREHLFAADGTTERRRILEDFITGQVRELLGSATRHIGAHTSPVLLGLDSLGALQLQQRLQTALDTEIKSGVIWVKSTVAALTEWLPEHTGLAGTSHA
ncbi:beta-ketoacyl reductase [Streptomyces klenkii]|uniref:beta-ketoacyl reductase n=1 Tax=Streptomyces klenkii TaxID=1420899 RepID=UPI003426F41F